MVGLPGIEKSVKAERAASPKETVIRLWIPSLAGFLLSLTQHCEMHKGACDQSGKPSPQQGPKISKDN